MCTKAISARGLRDLGFTAALGAAGLLFAASAQAAAPDSASATTADGKAEDGAKPEAGAKAEAGGKKPASPNDPREDPLKRYYFLGVRVRDIVLPQFMLELFTKGGSTANGWLIGPEFTTRKDRTEIDISLAFADYGYGPAMFKGKEDPDIAYEVIKSDLKIGYLTFDLLIDIPLDSSGIFSFLVGGGLGVGVVAGDLYRTQAYPKAGNSGDSPDPSQWEKCTGYLADGRDAATTYCDNGNSAYYDAANKKDYSEKSWFDGGSKPVIVPWLSIPQVSLRVKPIKQLQMRADVGWSITGFFFGASAGYGF